jgi:hypothetical protein
VSVSGASPTLTVKDTVNGTSTVLNTTLPIPVTPAVATKYVVTSPASTTAGSAFAMTVTALDAYGNVATGYTGTVHFTSTDTQPTLPGDYTFTASDVGIHTFAATLKTAGTETVLATDTAGTVAGTFFGAHRNGS